MFIVFTNFLQFLLVYVISYVDLFVFCHYVLVIFKVYKLLFLWGDSMRILLAEDERSLSSALVTILKYNNFLSMLVMMDKKLYLFLMLIIMI